ncbi:uncharacterized protein G2W53_017450 [Senna tora]|uniref:Uncharacterized protein n=1 Tax=Senna tora TaxID=362788 RepID=A0A834TST5_9FABA|nr:uncharacterized protein G2W53_017450 [Senna tora]
MAIYSSAPALAQVQAACRRVIERRRSQMQSEINFRECTTGASHEGRN